MQIQQSARTSKMFAGRDWASFRLYILALNLCLILNLCYFAPNQNDKNSIEVDRGSMVLAHCEESTNVTSNAPSEPAKPSPFLSNGTICQAFPAGMTASSLWNQYSEQIFNASIHPQDRQRRHAGWTRQLLKLLKPYHLERTLRKSPHHLHWKKIMTKVQARLDDPTHHPRVNVAVMGGSVPFGSKCNLLPQGLTVGPGVDTPMWEGDCSWVFRLQLLLDALLGRPDVVKIHNLAVGGTHSGMAVPILDYWLFPPHSNLTQAGGPDIIVNAFAANDNLPPAGEDPNRTGDFRFFWKAWNLAQPFMRTSFESRPCQDDPLVLFVDDYLGNQHDFILGEEMRREVVELLTHWYSNAGLISPAHVLRKWIYADTNEFIISPRWKDARGKKKIDVHYFMPGHVLVSWAVAFALLEMLVNFCEEERAVGVLDNGGIDSLTQLFLPPAEHLHLLDEEMAPDLNYKLQLEQIMPKWQTEASQRREFLKDYCAAGIGNVAPCSFAFVAAPQGTARNANELNKYTEQFVAYRDGWWGDQDISTGGWALKCGYVAHKPNSTVTFHIPETTNLVQKITIQYLKSYGEKWAGSKARFTLQWNNTASGKTYRQEWELLGYHDQETSISYPYVLELEAENVAQKGSSLDLRIDLVGGSTFKINAMMLCSR